MHDRSWIFLHSLSAEKWMQHPVINKKLRITSFKELFSSLSHQIPVQMECYCFRIWVEQAHLFFDFIERASIRVQCSLVRFWSYNSTWLHEHEKFCECGRRKKKLLLNADMCDSSIQFLSAVFFIYLDRTLKYRCRLDLKFSWS